LGKKNGAWCSAFTKTERRRGGVWRQTKRKPPFANGERMVSEEAKRGGSVNRGGEHRISKIANLKTEKKKKGCLPAKGAKRSSLKKKGV